MLAGMLKADPEDALETADTKTNTEEAGSSKPWFVYPLLTAAIVSVSSAAVTFSSMSEITPFVLASWRLQITATLLVPAGLHSFLNMTADERRRSLHEVHLVTAAGLLLGAHFGSWVVCIESTSLTHALLIGSTPPIIIAAGMLLSRHPISQGELVGTGLAAVGAVVFCQSSGNEKAVTLYGDCIGFLSAAFFVVYLAIGRTMRSWMPIFAYVLPVNLMAALSLCCAAILIDGAGFNTSPHGIFGYLGSWSYFWRSAYLGAVPGIAGHVTFNALLKWMHPLLLALPGTTEPFIGSLLGLAFGIGTLPGLFTYLGGSILIAATVLVILSSYKREKDEAALRKSGGAVAMTGILTVDPRDAQAGTAVTGPEEERIPLNSGRIGS